MLPIGKLVDVFGRKKPLMLSSASLAMGIAFFLTGEVFRLYIFYALTAVGNALAFTAYPSLQADWTPQEYRGRVMGFSNFTDCFLGAGAVLPDGFLYENISPVTPFLVQLAVMAIAVPATHLFVKESESKQK